MIKKIAFSIICFFVLLGAGTSHAQYLVTFGELLAKGIAEIKAENYEEAVGTLTAAREKQRDSAQAAFYLGLAHKMTGNYGDAEKNYLDAVKYKPEVKDAYLELAEINYNLNRNEEALRWLVTAEKENVSPANAAFLRGQVYVRQNMLDDAIEQFRKAKTLDSKLTQTADFQISMVLARQNRLTEARDTLRTITLLTPDSDFREFAREYEAVISKKIEKYRPWRLTGGIAYMYDDNVYAAPSTEISGLTITGEKDSSTVGTFKIDYTPMLSGPWFFNAQYSAYENYHYRRHDYDILSQALTLMPGYNLQNGNITVPVSYNHVMLGDRAYLQMLSVKPTYSVLLPFSSIGQLSAGYTKREMEKAPSIQEEDRDASIMNASAAYIYTFMNGKGMVNLRYEFIREDTEGSNWDSTTNRINAGFIYPFPKCRLNLILTGDVSLTDYRRENTVFMKKRMDRLYTGSIGANWEVFEGKGLSMNVQYSRTRADSNIAVYDYDRNTFLLGFEYVY